MKKYSTYLADNSMRIKKTNAFILRPILASILVVGSGALSLNSFAAQETGQFGVTATVAVSCAVSGTDLAFGNVSVLGGDGDQTSTIAATCTNGGAYTIGLNAGVGGTSVIDRKMTHSVTSTEKLDYKLTTDAGYQLNWDDVGGINVVSSTGSGSAQNLTVYGRIPSGQINAIVGDYNDTLIVTINY